MSEISVMTVEEAAKELRISRNSAYAAVARKEIPSVRIGRKILVPRMALLRLLEGENAAPEAG